MYQQMALTASGVSFAWSRFNAEEVLSHDQIVIQAHDEFQALNDSGEVRPLLFVIIGLLIMSSDSVFSDF